MITQQDMIDSLEIDAVNYWQRPDDFGGWEGVYIRLGGVRRFVAGWEGQPYPDAALLEDLARLRWLGEE
jgi:hypothetical protein